MGKRKSAGQPWVRCPALVLCGLQNRGGRNQLGAHQQHEGVQGVSPWHTTLLARYSVLYLPATGVRKRGRKVGQSALYHGLGKGARGWQVYKVRADHLIRWYALGRNCQSSHSPLWASHHAGKSGSFGERVGLTAGAIIAVAVFFINGEMQRVSGDTPKYRNFNKVPLSSVQ